ncbi:hypothetical protein BHE74_00017315 [Ensete ventricosum]|nr:hypothetical protein GW17_00001582 [Ensete ventricosum]RWW74732.1 hypothetical protein BHE74_00017315 [Ensete ventricosum]RZR77724.1 hypothetical protein BHM03_00002875 [Ensete ventricosum]
MSLTSIQVKLHASAPCSIFYIDSLHAVWILHQVVSKLLRSLICIELMVAFMPTTLWVSPPLNLISISTLNGASYDVVMDCSPT